MKVDIVMEVCFRQLDEYEKSDDVFFKQIRSLWLLQGVYALPGVF